MKTYNVFFILMVIVLNYFVLFDRQAISASCSNDVEKYHKMAFNFKIEKMSSGSKYVRLEGKDSNGKYVEWQDIDRWVLDNKNRIHIGDSIRKELGTTTLIVKNYRDGYVDKIYYECRDSIYR